LLTWHKLWIDFSRIQSLLLELLNFVVIDQDAVAIKCSAFPLFKLSFLGLGNYEVHLVRRDVLLELPFLELGFPIAFAAAC